MTDDTPAIDIRLIDSLEEFAALRESWRELHARNPNHTPFQSWEWNYAWWKHFGEPGRLRIFVAEESGVPIGIAPLCLNRRFRGWPLAHLGFISRKRADYLDFLVAPGKEAQFFQTLFTHLRNLAKQWNFLDLSDLQQGSSNLTPILTAAGRSFPTAGIEAREICVTVPLEDSWEAFNAGLGKNARRNIGRYGRQLDREFRVELRIPSGRDEMRRGLEDFAHIYRQRWREEHGNTYFDTHAALEFEREVCDLATASGWYRLYLLYADDKPVAGYLGYVCGNKYYAGLLAHVPEFHKYSVGTVLIARTIEDCIANGWSALDMTRGDEPYKYHWNGIARRNFHVRIFANRFALVRVAIADWLYWRATGIGALHRLRSAIRRFKNGPSTGNPATTANKTMDTDAETQ